MGSIESIAYFVWSPFIPRDYLRFGIDILRDRYHVCVFDCSPWLSPSSRIAAGDQGIAWFPGYVRLDSQDAVLAELNRSGFGVRWAAFDHLGPCAGSNWIRRQIKSRGGERIECMLGNLPPIQTKPREWVRRIWTMRHKVPSAALSRLHQLRSSPPDIAIVAGRHAASAYALPTRIIDAHSLDYETARAAVSIPHLLSGRYAVYLDEDMVSHQDYDQLSIPPATSADRFFPALNHLFDVFEKQTGMPVVIAAHPKSTYENQPDVFGGRRMFKNCTPELVRHASLVLAHATTSISFAVIWQRPVILLTSDDIERHPLVGGRVRAFAESLRSTVINIDYLTGNIGKLDELLQWDARAYEEYRRDFLKIDGSPQASLWAIVADALLTTDLSVQCRHNQRIQGKC